MQQRIPENQKTKMIYNYIKEERYQEAIKYLSIEIQFCPKSRVMSLLAYCHFMAQDYRNAAQVYEQLTYLYPEVDDYKLYYAQSLYKEGELENALRVTATIKNTKFDQQLVILTAYIKYEMEEFNVAKNLSESMDSDASSIILRASILLKEEKYKEALELFEHSKGIVGSNPELLYNIALCHYRLKHYDKCMQFIAEIIERGTREHPELGVGTNEEGAEVPSVGNTQTLKESALIEAFNLKAALEYQLKKYTAAREALWDMPPRSEEEFDAVTLMNHALFNIDNEPSAGFKKLNYLLYNPPFPPETFTNILLLYTKFNYFDLAADVLAENSDLTFKYIKQEVYDYLEALIFQNTNPEETIKKLEVLGNKHLDNFRRITKAIREAQQEKDDAVLNKTLKDYDEALENYIPVLMAQCSIHWKKEEFKDVEKLLMNAREFCAVHDTWKLNLGHTFFILEENYVEAIQQYETIYNKNLSSLLELPAIVIANLCVSYIMITRNEKAEDIIRTLEEIEARAMEEYPDRNFYHLCIVNLVIGTLYCSKGNFEFGIGRIIKSFDPINKKLGPDTWFYAKRCLMALIEKMSKNMIIIPDRSITEILDFLDSCEQFGSRVKANLEVSLDGIDTYVTQEARLLKRMFIKLTD